MNCIYLFLKQENSFLCDASVTDSLMSKTYLFGFGKNPFNGKVGSPEKKNLSILNIIITNQLSMNSSKNKKQKILA